MPIDKFGRHILEKQISDYASTFQRPYTCMLYIRGKDKGSQIYQFPEYTFVLENNTVNYQIPVDGTISNIVSFPNSIYYHYNHSTQYPIYSLIGKKVLKGDTLVFTAPKIVSDVLYIEIAMTCV